MENLSAKNLRLGNIVRSKINGISKVEQIGSSINSEYVGGRSLEGNYWENSYLPVEINEEWLLDFGFEKRKVDFPSFQLNGIQINYINGKWQDYVSQRGLPHIHELQNLYFAMTGEELTITKDFTE